MKTEDVKNLKSIFAKVLKESLQIYLTKFIDVYFYVQNVIDASHLRELVNDTMCAYYGLYSTCGHAINNSLLW